MCVYIYIYRHTHSRADRQNSMLSGVKTGDEITESASMFYYVVPSNKPIRN